MTDRSVEVMATDHSFDRWAGWAREPFTSESRQHVSVWQKPAG